MGENPFPLPSQRLRAQAGDFALLPSAGSLKEALRRDTAWARLVYTRAALEELGASESRVRWLSQQRGSVANALIIPLPPSELVRRGDIVLTLGASASGLDRAVAVSEGATPNARSLDEPAGVSAAPRVLERGTFVVLRRAGDVGTTLACRDGERFAPYVLAVAAGEQLLGVGFAGQSLIFSRAQCKELALAPALEPGDRVFVPVAGAFVPAEVKEDDAVNSRVRVGLQFASEQREVNVAKINVATDLGR